MDHLLSNTGAIHYNGAVNDQFCKVSQPLFDCLGLTHFIYIKLIDKKRRLYLCNDKDWVKFHVQHRLHEDIKHENSAIKENFSGVRKYGFWKEYKKDRVFNACYSRGMWNGFIIYDGDEIFSFAAKKDSTVINNTYMENLDLFEHFMIYFKNDARHIINSHDDAALIHSKDLKPIEPPEEVIKRKLFLERTQLNRFYTSEDPDRYLTRNRAMCLAILAEGKTVKEIGAQMNLSYRTVEKYLEITKNEFGLHTKADLIDLGNTLNIKKYLFDEGGE